MAPIDDDGLIVASLELVCVERLREDLVREGAASLFAVAGRLPTKLGRRWLEKQ